jgi:phosphate transport system permease protein
MRLPPAVANRLVSVLLWLVALCTVGILIFIVRHVLERGIPVLSWTFLTGSPQDMGREGGILPIIVGTVYLTLVAILIAAPLGVGSAVFLTEYTREGHLTRIIRFGADCLAGIPSIIYGLFGFVFFVIYLGLGWSILSGGLTLALMILPTIIRTSEEAIRAVPDSLREAAYGLGSSRSQMVATVVLPQALPGIVTGLVLGIGRSISETAAVMLTAGASLRFPTSPFDSARTMSYHFYILVREGISVEKAYGTAAILIVVILIINFVAYWLMRRLIAGTR